MYDWNDLKALLAVARTGSTLAAARTLGVNQTTVARRIEALERALGVRLVDRGQAGSRLTPEGASLLAHAEAVERAAESLGDRASERRRSLTGAIRVTATEVVGNNVITPAIAAFRQQHPQVEIDLVLTERLLDVAGGEADIAIRTVEALESSDLVARKLADYEFALYCSAAYAERRGRPTLETLKDHDLIAGRHEGGDLPGAAWVQAMAGGKAPAIRSNSVGNLLHSLRAGLGVAPMACVLADQDPLLVRCSDILPHARLSSWMLTRKGARDTPRLAVFIDFLIAQFKVRERARADGVPVANAM